MILLYWKIYVCGLIV